MLLLKHIHQPLLSLPRWAKRIILWTFDFASMPMLFLASYMLRFSHVPDFPMDRDFLILVPFITVLFLQLTGFYRIVIRFIDFSALNSIAWGLGFAVINLYILAYLAEPLNTPRSIFIIYGALAAAYLVGSRLLAREFLRWTGLTGYKRIPVVIFGAGSAGMQTAASLKHEALYRPMAFIDDSTSLQGQLLTGLPVYGRKGFINWLKKNSDVRTVLMAMPSTTDDQRREALRFIQPLGLAIKTLPGLSDLVSGKANLSDIKDVNAFDLLGRNVVGPSNELMASVISGSRVMISGAGGSIGSELCRQIMRLKPKKLVLFDLSEFALYQIEQYLQSYPEAKSVEIVAILGSVLDAQMVELILNQQSIQIVFHAAAYKHVPLVESNISSGVKNNVFGTKILAEASLKYGVERFILISTDKAVRPTNVMGASKRLAELILQGLSDESSSTIFSMVRFGNVLASSGSVVPRFRAQINAGGPVTVTHPDITRYFMTIPEAASLVIQAGAMAKGGEVYLLDMGDPIKIDQLARTMIQLMGRTVRDESGNGDIEIAYSGLRPGEKLYEELLIDAKANDTEHPKIFHAHEAKILWIDLEKKLIELADYCENMQVKEITQLLQQCVDGYTPDINIVDPFGKN